MRLPAIGVWAAAGLLAAAGLSAQQVSFLSSGPTRGAGIQWLPANVLPYYEGTYDYLGMKVAVFFTPTDIPSAAAWPQASCATAGVRTVPESGPAEPGGAALSVYYYSQGSDLSLFLAFPDAGRATACAFVDRFVERFNYFLGVTHNDAPSSFPAILRF